MHITPPRVLGFLMFLALIGYAFFLGPQISATSTHSPATSVTAPKATPSGIPGSGSGSALQPAGPSSPDTPSTLSTPSRASRLSAE